MSTYKGFTHVKLRKPERSKFDLSHEKKLSTRMGKLVPVFISEVLPNDTFRVNSEVMLRFAPLIAPIYHRVNVFVHFFYVSNRLLYKDWEKFITRGRLGTEVAPVPPYGSIRSILETNGNRFAKGSLSDYLGILPIADASAAAWNVNQAVSMLPYAAYYKIWYDYYRDRNYIPDNEVLPLPSGEIPGGSLGIMDLRTRAWQHDYFTSALPWTQRGNEVLMPMSGVATGSNIEYSPFAQLVTAHAGSGLENVQAIGSAGTPPRALRTSAGATGLQNISSITVENSTISINDVRRAIRLQEWLERNAVAGSRYNESIMAHFNRRTSDGRLQRAEYLGGGRVPVQISEVMTTAFSEDATAQTIPPASMAGRGATYAKNNGFRYNCEEHGFIIGIMSVMPTSAYMQGIPRMFAERDTFLDYPWPSFAHLGEQPVYTYELYATPATYKNRTTPGEQMLFGYQSRYADWKYMYSTAHGDFRTTLDFWHLDRKFASTPNLGNQFVTFEDSLQNRVFAVANVDTLWCYIYNKASVVRSLPYFGTPML